MGQQMGNCNDPWANKWEILTINGTTKRKSGQYIEQQIGIHDDTWGNKWESRRYAWQRMGSHDNTWGNK